MQTSEKRTHEVKIIDRIEIHRFRSIGDESIPAADINVYSGVNNSGKSNILRALNLFFNQETSYDSPFDFAKDYNKAYTGQAGGAREIRIILHFMPQGEGALSSPFSVTRSFRLGEASFDTEYWSANPATQKLIEADNGNVKRQFTRFINTIRFFYIPAVRDKRFVRHLFLNFEQIVTDKQGEDFKQKLDDLSDIISARSEAISKDFEQFLKLPTKAVISSDAQDILGSIQVNVNSGLQILKKSKDKSKTSEITPVPVDLFSSGDGVLMAYLAYFLAHLCRETPRVRYIWGFEEPENSLEYSKVQRLADEFVHKFNRYAQIFLTTHSPAFVNLRHLTQVAFYRAYIEPSSDRGKPDKRLTRVRTLQDIEKLQLSLLGDEKNETELEVLRRELGMVEFSREIERAAQELQATKAKHEEAIKKVEQSLVDIDKTYPEKIFIIEDSKASTVKVWRHLLDSSNLKDVTIMSSEGCTNNKIEEHLLLLQKNRPSYKPRVMRQIDRDGLLDAQIKYIEEQVSPVVGRKFKYKLVALPVNEVENFALSAEIVGNVRAESEQEIVDRFELTAKGKVGELYRKYPNAPDDMFKHGYDELPVIQKMRAAAIENWKLYMPGKDICKKLSNFNATAIIEGWKPDQWPSELIEYMKVSRLFFEAEEK